MAKILYYGEFDGNLFRPEYIILHHLVSAGHTVFFANYLKRNNAEAFWKVYSKETDLVLVQAGSGFKSEYLGIFNVPFILLAQEHSVKTIRPLLEAKNKPALVLAADKTVYDYCQQKQLNVKRLMTAYNPAHYFSFHTDYIYDVCFMGTITPRRLKILENLKKLKKYKLLAGNAKDPYKRNRYYNTSKIVLHIHSGEERYIPARAFEVMPTRGCLLTEEPGETISDKKFCETFSTEKEMVEKIEMLLRSETSRNLLIKQANRLAPQHSWNERSKILNAAIKEVKTIKKM